MVKMFLLGFFLSLLLVSAPSDQTFRERLGVFTSVLRLIRDDYVDSVDTHEIIVSGIQGMLSALDPHSDFLDADTYSKMTEEHRGSFFGVGMTIAVQNEKLVVISPIEGTPAARAGILTGDHILSIDGQSTRGMSSDRAAELIRGPKGTKVVIVIQREGVDHELTFELVREEIPITSVPYAFFLEPGVAYLRLSRFARNTAQEMDLAMQKLQQADSVLAVVLDLRGNSGGLLSSAVEVANRFLPSGSLIVFTSGRIARSNQREFAKAGFTWPRWPLVVLVDRGSASASEIVAGAVQDWDRGLIVGRTTFGKGLVQNVYELDGGNALKLTTARYFTPSGRVIQREYNGTRYEYYRRAGVKSDTTRVYATRSGRLIRGGGGITPDLELPEPRRLTRLEVEAQRKGVVFQAASHFAAYHRDLRETYESFEAFQSLFQISQDLEDSLKASFQAAGVQLDESSWAQSRDYLLLALKAEIAGHLWGPQERYRVLVSQDEDVAAALRALPEARKLLTLEPKPGNEWPSARLDTELKQS